MRGTQPQSIVFCREYTPAQYNTTFTIEERTAKQSLTLPSLLFSFGLSHIPGRPLNGSVIILLTPRWRIKVVQPEDKLNEHGKYKESLRHRWQREKAI